MENLKEIIKELKKIREEEKLDISDEILFDASVRINDTLFMNDKNYERKQELASKEQLYYLNKNKLDYPKDITKTEAFGLIREHKGKGGKNEK